MWYNHLNTKTSIYAIYCHGAHLGVVKTSDGTIIRMLRDPLKDLINNGRLIHFPTFESGVKFLQYLKSMMPELANDDVFVQKVFEYTMHIES